MNTTTTDIFEGLDTVEEHMDRLRDVLRIPETAAAVLASHQTTVLGLVNLDLTGIEADEVQVAQAREVVHRGLMALNTLIENGEI